PSSKEKKQNQGYIYDTNGIKAKIRNIFQNGQFKFVNGKIATDSDILQFLYKINFITARKILKSGRIDRKFFEENRLLSNQTVNFGYDWEVHPAFRWALEPEDANMHFTKIDLSAD